MNPEFQRNLMLELSIHRLIAMPVILLLVFVATGALAGEDAVTHVATGVLWLLLVLWGSRLAAETVLGEVVGRTWDAQRMSSIGPWAMSWGKLFGSTVFIWYGALWCVPGYFWSGQKSVADLAEIALLGLFTHAIALFLSLMVLRVRPGGMRFQVTLVHVLALSAALLYQAGLQQIVTLPSWAVVRWYGVAIDGAVFRLASEVIFLAWAIIGLYRLMRLELQFRPGIYTRLVFVLFVAAYAGGLPDTVHSVARWFVAFGATVLVTYVAAFVEPKGFGRLRRWGYYLKTRDLARALTTAPTWVVSGSIAVLLGVVTIALWSTMDARDAIDAAPGLSVFFDIRYPKLAPFIIAISLFLTRDIGIIYFFTLDGRAKRGHLTSLVYLGVLYILTPLILSAFNLDRLVPIAVPSPYGDPALVILPALIQAGLVALLIAWRWRRLERTGLGSVPAG
ncbi:MAG: hypothetical protein O7A65_04595 [Proteobacteria bacterium]|nr:hypothetical protein [Pseudomonadota bacterium]